MSFPRDASTTQILGRNDNSSRIPIGYINFVANGTGAAAKFCVVPKDIPAGDVAEEFLRTRCKLAVPKVLISVTGGARDFKVTPKLERIISKGLLRAAQNTSACIVTGGIDTGVMKYVGDALRNYDANIPCIGVATYQKVFLKDKLIPNGSTVQYEPNSSASLNPNHTHFVLVDSPVIQWGEEIQLRSELEEHISTKWKVPMILVSVNGGPGTLRTICEGAQRKFPIIVIETSGRTSDAVACYFKTRRDPYKYQNNMNEWLNFLDPNQKHENIELMEEIYANQQYVTIFNPNDNEDIDKVILKCILRLDTNSALNQKLSLCVQWGRGDLIEELLEQYEPSTISSSSNTITNSTEIKDKASALNNALQMALKLNNPAIYELLVNKGASKTAINMAKLYNLEDVKYQIERLGPFAGIISGTNQVDENTPFLDINSNTESLATAEQILNAINPVYTKLLVDEQVTFTDVLVWAILVDRVELAKAIWRQTTLPVHSALLACHVYSVLIHWLPGDEHYQTCKDWFEQQAIDVLSEVKYKDAVEIFEWRWAALESIDVIELSSRGQCKNFFSQAYVQRYLDGKMYSDDNGQIPPGTRMWKVILLVIFPFLIPGGPYILNTKEDENGIKRKSHLRFYTLPVLDIFFLALLTVNLMTIDPNPENHDRFKLMWWEWTLWVWILASIVEEIAQFWEDRTLLYSAVQPHGYCNVSLVDFMARVLESQLLLLACTDILIVSTIACYLRVMNVFAFSKSLGPLFFVISRLSRDVLHWLFIFLLFMISFQAGIFALTKQAGAPAWKPYPHGSMGSAFTAILGDLGNETMDWMTDTHVGVVLVLAYSLITQVMLVNLLIAMMGDTYTSVKENSGKEWKFYRYSLVLDHVKSSPYPPPFNLLLCPLLFAMTKLNQYNDKHSNVLNVTGLVDRDPNTWFKMKLAKEKVVEREANADALQTMREQMKTMNEQMSLVLGALNTLQQQMEKLKKE